MIVLVERVMNDLTASGRQALPEMRGRRAIIGTQGGETPKTLVRPAGRGAAAHLKITCSAFRLQNGGLGET